MFPDDVTMTESAVIYWLAGIVVQVHWLLNCYLLFDFNLNFPVVVTLPILKYSSINILGSVLQREKCCKNIGQEVMNLTKITLNLSPVLGFQIETLT